MRTTADIGPHRVIAELPAGSLGRRFATSIEGRPAIVEATRLRGHDEVVERAIRRVELMVEIKHPNLVPVLDAGMDSDVLYVVTPAPDHTALDTVASTDLPRTLRSVGGALVHLHRRGVIHRDVQRRHIGCYDNVVRLGGLGLSDVLTDGRTHGTGPIGGVLTMAPSVVRGEPATFGSDLYALGAVAHLMATGQAVHDIRAESLAGRLRRIADESPQISLALPPDLQPLVAAALAADGSNDPGCADHVLEQLTQGERQ